MTRRQSSALASRLFAAAAIAADSDTAATLTEITADLINHANGHPTWMEA